MNWADLPRETLPGVGECVVRDNLGKLGKGARKRRAEGRRRFEADPRCIQALRLMADGRMVYSYETLYKDEYFWAGEDKPSTPAPLFGAMAYVAGYSERLSKDTDNHYDRINDAGRALLAQLDAAREAGRGR